MPNSTWMMSENGQLAVYSGSIGNFTEDRWKNARKITIPVGYSIQPTIFPGVVLPAVPATPAPPATTTRPATPAATTAATTIAATTPIVDTITVSKLDNAKTIGANSSNYSSAYGAITYNI